MISTQLAILLLVVVPAFALMVIIWKDVYGDRRRR